MTGTVDAADRLDVGCGANKRGPDALGIDIRDYGPVDIVQDIEETPWRDDQGDVLPADHFGHVDAYSILEHVADLPAVMAEIHRVCRDGATVEGKVPHWRDRNAYIDPTHEAFIQDETGTVYPVTYSEVTGTDTIYFAQGRAVAGFDERTFEFWDSTTELGQRDYFDAEFRVQQARRIRRVKFWRSRPITFTLRVVKEDE